MHEYGLTKEQLGWVAITDRAHAALNPDAVFTEPLTMDDYLDARPITSPLSLFDCDVPVDGSVAVVDLRRRRRRPSCADPSGSRRWVAPCATGPCGTSGTT